MIVQNTLLSENEVYQFNLYRYYNKLAYLKEEGKFQLELNGNSR